MIKIDYSTDSPFRATCECGWESMSTPHISNALTWSENHAIGEKWKYSFLEYLGKVDA